MKARGGADAAVLADRILHKESGGFERPTPDEAVHFGRYIGPADQWAV